MNPSPAARVAAPAIRRVVLVGHHNVGKSVIFSRLTGRQTITSNFPGTTVELTRGRARFAPAIEVVDTPGLLALPARTADEQAVTEILLGEPTQSVVQVADAKNIRRTLLLTVQLTEMGLPLIVVLNMMDEALARGVELDEGRLSAHLGVPVVSATATSGAGLAELRSLLVTAPKRAQRPRIRYPEALEAAVAEIAAEFPSAPLDKEALVLAWLSDDTVVDRWLCLSLDETAYLQLAEKRQNLQLAFTQPLSTIIQNARLAHVDRILSRIPHRPGAAWGGFSRRLADLTTHPLWGLPVLAAVLLGMYGFVGILGAGILVDFLETRVFGELINPWLIQRFAGSIASPFLNGLLFGEYGLWTMGITYAFALILPIVTTFFLAFGVLEDTGYLSRLTVLSNRIFNLMGLNGKAVVPMVLGLGCVTMATLTTRILDTRRERLLAILLLALAVPCSAQLGVIMGLLAGVSFAATTIWATVVILVLLSVGALSSRLIPGERSPFLVELPPLRRPIFANVALKTLARIEWYLKEVLPLFLLGAGAMFLLDWTGVLSNVVRAAEPLVVSWLGLPPEVSAAFLMGFMRRDFGATGLFVMDSQGLLTPAQIVVAMVTVTLFIPCIASVLVVARERNIKTALALMAIIFPLAFFVGGLLNRTLSLIGWGLQ